MIKVEKQRERMRAGAVRVSCLVAAGTFMVSASMLDSLTWIPFILCCVSLGWLMLVATANFPYKKR